VLPLAVLWFGALGGVTISLYGVFEHRNDWKEKWNYWHIARPAVGAIMAMVGFFIYVAAIQATSTEPDIPPSGTGAFVYFALAFVLGYREATVRTLIKRFVDLILTPKASEEPPGETPE
jgi:hypothetical protein